MCQVGLWLARDSRCSAYFGQCNIYLKMSDRLGSKGCDSGYDVCFSSGVMEEVLSLSPSVHLTTVRQLLGLLDHNDVDYSLLGAKSLTALHKQIRDSVNSVEGHVLPALYSNLAKIARYLIHRQLKRCLLTNGSCPADYRIICYSRAGVCYNLTMLSRRVEASVS